VEVYLLVLAGAVQEAGVLAPPVRGQSAEVVCQQQAVRVETTLGDLGLVLGVRLRQLMVLLVPSAEEAVVAGKGLALAVMVEMVALGQTLPRRQVVVVGLVVGVEVVQVLVRAPVPLQEVEDYGAGVALVLVPLLLS
jgi:hypothetical protein